MNNDAIPAMDLTDDHAIILPGGVPAVVRWAITNGDVTTVSTSCGDYRYHPLQPVPVIEN